MIDFIEGTVESKAPGELVISAGGVGFLLLCSNATLAEAPAKGEKWRCYSVLNVREDLMPRFRMGGTFRADVPALDRRGVVFRVYYISPLGSYATWRSTKQAGSYDLRTFELKARPEPAVEGLRPGMSVLVNLSEQP